MGGAVRDKLLGIPVKDKDWVVTGSTPEEMKQQGFVPVGKDFPVFLHPDTKEEYALARTERKSGHGYAGFTFHAAADVNLEDDLVRRDLTINAIAEDRAGNLIDPYGGQQDIQDKILRHVSPAFQEDPLRILRVARFYARLKPLGFSLASETLGLMSDMVESGEASFLVAERVWQETHRALMEPAPDAFFEILRQCEALSVVMPELHHLLQQNNNLPVLLKAADSDAPDIIRFGCLWAGVPEQSTDLKAMAKRMRLPAAFAEIAQLVMEQGLTVQSVLGHLTAEALMNLFEQADALRRPERFADLLECSRLISTGRLSARQTDNACQLLRECLAMNARAIVEKGFKGREVGEQLRIARLGKLKKLIAEN